MSKWALFAAHRYLERDSGVRTVGADGRSLRHRWRQRSPAAQAEARLRRAARTQPCWPRPLGCVLIGMALVAVIDADWAIPSHVGASSTARRADLRPVAAAPSGVTEGTPPAFRLDGGDLPPPFTVVLLDGSYAELARTADVGGPTFAPPPEWREPLGRGGEFHWFVEGMDGGRVVRSPLASFEIR